MATSRKLGGIGAAFLIGIAGATCLAQQTMRELFQDPPQEARPHVWWHWMNGNITKEGIYKDLMWMNRVGIGGFHHFDAGLSTTPIVDKRLIYMDEGWKDAFQYATYLADSLRMEMAVASAPGWSNTGGPWVRPEHAMKKLTWRETLVKVERGEAKAITLRLPAPYLATGYFLNQPLADATTMSASDTAGEEQYQDIAVLAVRLNDAEKTLADMGATVSSSGGAFTVSQLTDGDLNNPSALPADDERGYAWIQYAFPAPVTIKALSISDGIVRSEWDAAPANAFKHLEASDDGVSYRPVCDVPYGGTYRQTIDIPTTTARYFRMRFDNPVSSGTLAALYGTQPRKETMVSEWVLYPVSKIHRAEERAGFASPHDMMEGDTPAEANVSALADVIDLTDRMDSEGRITWDAPEGIWRIYRFGYSLTGKKNHPAPPEATGLEVDKLDKEAVHAYISHYLDMYKDASDGLMGERGLRYLLIDSYEAGWETWTARMAQEFEQRRGYSLLPWMPVLTGQIIGSSEQSEQFLWDWRKTIGELIVENLYVEVRKVAAERGLRCYFESHENGRQYLADGIEVKKEADIPMAAIWCEGGTDQAMSECDIRESASVAHLYGQNLVALESFTAQGFGDHAYTFYPGNLKPTADLAMSCGVNRFVIHESAHQPVDDKKPGLGLMIFGQWFNRHETWAEQAKAWTDYLARSSFMLQQGHYVADILYYYGEDNCVTGLFSRRPPQVPAGYNFDYLNADALLHEIACVDGKLVAAKGKNTYRLLALDKNARSMSLPVLRKIAELVRQGAAVCGQKPEYEPSLHGDKAEFQRLVEEIWNAGQARVFADGDIAAALGQLDIAPDLMNTDMSDLRFVHRSTDGHEIYWISNCTDAPRRIKAILRTGGRKPMLWHPETGQAEEVSYKLTDGMTVVSFDMVARDAVFIVLAGEAREGEERILPTRTETAWMDLNTTWQVTFPEGMGAPASASFDRLASLT